MPGRGKLRHLLTVQKQTTVENENGTWDQTWLTVATRWAEVLPISGREYIEAHAVTANVTHKVRMDKYDSLKPATYRLVRTDGEVLNIESVLDFKGRGKMQEVMCKEDVGG